MSLNLTDNNNNNEKGRDSNETSDDNDHTSKSDVCEKVYGTDDLSVSGLLVNQLPLEKVSSKEKD